jgi:hypothetical protein
VDWPRRIGALFDSRGRWPRRRRLRRALKLSRAAIVVFASLNIEEFRGVTRKPQALTNRSERCNHELIAAHGQRSVGMGESPSARRESDRVFGIGAREAQTMCSQLRMQPACVVSRQRFGPVAAISAIPTALVSRPRSTRAALLGGAWLGALEQIPVEFTYNLRA